MTLKNTSGANNRTKSYLFLKYALVYFSPGIVGFPQAGLYHFSLKKWAQ